MAPAISSQQEITRDPQSAQSHLSSPLLPVTRHSHCTTFRRNTLAHKRRFRHRQFSDNSTAIPSASSAVDGGGTPPLPYSPAVDQYSSLFPSADMPTTTTTVVSDSTLSEPALSQSQARNRATGITAALIAVCVLVGLAACAVMGRLAYRRRLSLLRRFRRHRQAEDNLGFVFIEYDNSAWGPPAKHMRKDMRSPEGEEQVEVLPVTSHLQTPLSRAWELDAIVASDGRDTSNTEDFDPCFRICHSATQSRTEVLNALGLANNVKQRTLTSPQLAAALASHPSEVDGVVGDTESIRSDSATCRHSTESSSSEEDNELQSLETHSMNFITVSLGSLADADCVEDKKFPLDIYDLPRVVISSTSSVASEDSSSRSKRASGVSVTTIDLGEFPRPPFITDKLDSTSTSLISEIEVSLGPVISGSLGMAAERGVSLAP
ncbi:hypothetical protein DFH94DRAFT_695853 [Russula ochroleuca]|uniref:Uncharacterized protein n=1 Tax=Russula ochroleuca TaxID=152965 RepID=A0A9P5K0S0_9AGAM|nr:hypothetical protein DFH94DRAFT_695853 [Russula ochroleuca]